MLLVLLFFFFSLSAAQHSSRFVSLCNHAAEPSVGEILGEVSPFHASNVKETVESLFSSSSFSSSSGGEKVDHHRLLMMAYQEIIGDAAETISQTKVPLASLISDGVFNVSTSKFNGSTIESDIKLIQKKPLLQRLLCSVVQFSPLQWTEGLAEVLPPALNLCRCWGGSMSLSDAALSVSSLGSDRVLDASPRSDDWCVATGSPCHEGTEEHESDRCVIHVDPFRPACVLFLAASSGEDTPDSSEYYSFEVPTLLDVDVMKSWLESWSRHSAALASFYEVGMTFLAPVLAHVPYYPAMLALATFLLLIEEDIADSKLVQLLVTIGLGVFLAVIAVVLAVYKNIESIKNSFFSFLPASLSTGFLSFLLFATSYTFKDVVLLQLWNFWLYGAFGVQWAGKAYFLSSIALSLLIKWWFGLFSEGSRSHSVLRYVIKGTCAMLLATQSSPSIELGFIFVAISFCQESLASWSESLWVYMSGMMQTPSHKYSGVQLMTEEQYKEHSNYHTAKALAELQQHLRENTSKVYDLTDRYQLQGDMSRIRLLERFAQGSYSGRPSEHDRELLEEAEQNSLRAKKTGFSILFFKTVLLTSVVVIVAAVLYQPNTLERVMQRIWRFVRSWTDNKDRSAEF